MSQKRKGLYSSYFIPASMKLNFLLFVLFDVVSYLLKKFKAKNIKSIFFEVHTCKLTKKSEYGSYST